MLIQNYTAKSTLHKSSDRVFKGDIPTPMIIVCSDPPHNDTENNIIQVVNDYFGMVPPVKTMRTIFKVCKISFSKLSMFIDFTSWCGCTHAKLSVSQEL